MRRTPRASPAAGPLLVLALALPAAGCGPATDSEAMTVIGDSLRFTIEAPDRVREGESVPVRLRLANVAPDTVVLHLLGRTIAFDLVVRRDGEVVWRRLEGEVVPQILQVRPLAPGESLELSGAWDQRTNAGRPAGPGRYTVQGVLPTDEPEPLRTARATVVVGGG